ncbi:(Fe-S)-binding protein [Thermus igniterrae]|jgi:Fe-S oxidoreductase|uniref:(Fe-S)-binding protein n=1 Tax=Thermus igniterrae TaxID=88189 RepID=UPI000370D20F|nr:(Fe-S)-binding protein [Thermus igniterrae]
MLTLPEKILFILLLAGSLYYAYTGFRRVYLAIRRGRPEDRFDRLSARIGRALWLTLTQQTVFKKRPLVSLLHAFVFYGFVYYLLVNLVDLVEGFFPLHARGGLWNPFNLVADLLTAAILVGILGLMVRRYLAAPQDFTWNPQVPLHERVRQGIPRDSAIVGAFITFHVGSRLLSKAATLAQSEPDPFQPVASLLAGGLAGLSPTALTFMEHFFWWGALGSILLFLPYFPRSKHIHLMMAPINLTFRSEKPGALLPLDLEKEESFGAEKLEDLSWKRLLDAYACIMCNRCQEVCPAYTTGKALSPAAILISERYELNDILPDFAAGKESPRPLMDFALNEEALWACTTCMACVEVCPVGNEQMLHILDVRRAKVLMEGAFPQELQNAFRGMERSGNPWGIGQDKRLDWAEGLAVPTVAEKPNPEVLYWVGCAPSYDPRAQKIARSMVAILNAAGVDWAVLGKREKCTGDAARRAGNEYLFFQLATENVETLNAVAPKTIVTTCPHCFHTLANEYRAYGGEYRVVHHTEFIAELLRSGRLKVSEETRRVVFHDPCYLGRHNGVYEAPRVVLKGVGLALTEPPRNREGSFCCGAGGAQFWKEEEPGAMRVSENRYRELKATGAEVIATGCPFCMAMMNVEVAQDQAPPEVLDVAELVARGLKA